jgi:hypothetical protein
MGTRLIFLWKIGINIDRIIFFSSHITHTNILQRLYRTVFISLNVHMYYHQETPAYMHNHPQASINNSNFWRLLPASWCKSATAANALKGFQCAGLYLHPQYSVRFLPSSHCTKGDSEHETCTSASPEHTVTESSASHVQSSAELLTASYSLGPSSVGSSCTRVYRKVSGLGR